MARLLSVGMPIAMMERTVEASSLRSPRRAAKAFFTTFALRSPVVTASTLRQAAGVIRSSDGSLYGLTAWGYYEGKLFQFSNGGWIGLHQFSIVSGPDGLNPVAPLVRDPSGVIYGATLIGSGINRPVHAPYWGIVFKWIF
jgi:hypothetical protein